MPVLSKRIVLDCFYLLIFYFEKFSTAVCRLPCAVNVNLNLSIAFFLSLFSPRQATSVLMSRICQICCMNLSTNHNYGCFMTQTNGCWEAEMHFLTG